MTVEDAVRELTEAVKESYESPESEVTYIEAPANPSDGDTLTYDATSGKWVAGAPQSGGGGFVATFTGTLPNSDGAISDIACDKTYAEIMEAIQGEGASFRLIDGDGSRVTPSSGYTINDWSFDETTLLITVHIFGSPDNSTGTMDLGAVGIFYSESALTAQYVHAWIGLAGG